MNAVPIGRSAEQTRESQLRILHVHTRYRERGGEDAVVDHERRLLREAGHEVIAWDARNSQQPLTALLQLIAAPGNPRAALVARQRVRRGRPDLMHVHNTWFALSPSVARAAREADIPVVMTLHNYRFACVNAQFLRNGEPCTLCLGRRPLPGVWHRCYRNSFAASGLAAATIMAAGRHRRSPRHGVSRYLVLTEFARGLAIKAGIPADRLTLKPNSAPDPGPRTTSARSSRRIVFLGRLSPEKGVRTLLDAWERAQPKHLELVIAGDGPLRAELERRSLRGAAFLGRVEASEVRRVLLGARALVVPSECFEGQPMSVIEGLAAGVPAMCSALGGCEEAAAALGPEWLVQPGRVDAWSAALARLADDELVARGSKQARQLYVSRYHPRCSMRALTDVYARAIRGDSRRHTD